MDSLKSLTIPQLIKKAVELDATHQILYNGGHITSPTRFSYMRYGTKIEVVVISSSIYGVTFFESTATAHGVVKTKRRFVGQSTFVTSRLKVALDHKF